MGKPHFPDRIAQFLVGLVALVCLIFFREKAAEVTA